jgi:hypothetical protein
MDDWKPQRFAGGQLTLFPLDVKQCKRRRKSAAGEGAEEKGGTPCKLLWKTGLWADCGWLGDLG